MWGSQFMGGGDWIWMSVMMALVWLPIILLVVWLLRGTTAERGRPTEPGPEDARDVARRAYASGDLNREQFHQILADLGAAPATHEGMSGGHRTP